MIGVLTLIAIGLLLMGLLPVLLRRTDSTEDERSFESLDGSLAGFMRFQERRKVIVDRIFGCEDWDFVLSHGSKDARRLFLIERKRIDLCWISEIRDQARAAMRFHVAHAARSRKLLPLLELRLALDYFSIRLKCELIALVLMLRGPVALRRMAGQVSHLAEQLRNLLEVAFETDAFSNESTVSH